MSDDGSVESTPGRRVRRRVQRRPGMGPSRLRAVIVALIAVVALVAASCSSGGSDTTAAAGGDATADGGTAGDDASGDAASGDPAGEDPADGPADDGADDAADDGADDPADDDAADDAADDDGAEAAADDAAAEEPAGPDVRTLELAPDPVGSTDPKETVNHLPSVQVFQAEDGIAFVFDSLPEDGNRVLIAPDGFEVFCDMWQDGESVRVECGGYDMNSGLFLDQVPVPQVDMALGYGLVVPMTIDGDMATITLAGTAYSAPQVRVAQEPAFVQIDVNTGGLAAEVVRTVGIATAADIAAALA